MTKVLLISINMPVPAQLHSTGSQTLCPRGTTALSGISFLKGGRYVLSGLPSPPFTDGSCTCQLMGEEGVFIEGVGLRV